MGSCPSGVGRGADEPPTALAIGIEARRARDSLRGATARPGGMAQRPETEGGGDPGEQREPSRGWDGDVGLEMYDELQWNTQQRKA